VKLKIDSILIHSTKTEKIENIFNFILVCRTV
jgi:hypothetical protein